MNIPIPEGEINEFKVMRGGKPTPDGAETCRIFCDDTEIPGNEVESMSIFLDVYNAKVTLNLMTNHHASVEIAASTVVIEGYTPIGVQREKKREKERGWVTE